MSSKMIWRLMATLVSLGLLATSCSMDVASDDLVIDENAEPEQTTIIETTQPPPEPALVYVSVGKDNKIVVLQLGTDGALTPREDLTVDLAGPAGAMTYSAAGQRLYVGAGNNISTVTIDEAGVPTLLGATPVDGEPVYLDLAAQNQILVVAYFGEDEVRTYSIGDDPNAYAVLQTDPWDTEPHAIVVNEDGTRAYVTHRNANSVGVYSIDETGTLNQQNRIGDVGSGPRHITLSADGRFAFVVNEQGDSVTSFTVQPDGNLTMNNSVPTIGDDVDPESNTGADIHATPDGRFVYTSNRGDDSVAMFSVDEAGQLTPLGNVATQERPRGFGMSPDGRFIVVAGQGSGQVESFAIGDDGLLTSVDSAPVGDGPVWVEII